MKKQLPGFILGFLCAFLLFGMTISGYALITERTAIEVDPINVMVNGEVFQPRNAQGELVDVFAYNGTTYAPLRALAEAYGLEVGYDAEKNLATVSKPGNFVPSWYDKREYSTDYSDWSADDEAAYQEFKAQWSVVIRGTKDTTWLGLGPISDSAIVEMLSTTPPETIQKYCARFDVELYAQYQISKIFYTIWSRYAEGSWQDELFDDGWGYGYMRYYQEVMQYYFKN